MRDHAVGLRKVCAPEGTRNPNLLIRRLIIRRHSATHCADARRLAEDAASLGRLWGGAAALTGQGRRWPDIRGLPNSGRINAVRDVRHSVPDGSVLVPGSRELGRSCRC
jgi:hypothetical protein